MVAIHIKKNNVEDELEEDIWYLMDWMKNCIILIDLKEWYDE